MPIRICVLNPNYYRSSGVTTVIKRLALVRSEQVFWGFATCLYGKESSSEDCGWFPGGIQPKIFNLMTLNPVLFLLNLRRFVNYLADGGFDVLHVHHRRLLVVAWMTKCLTGIRVVYTSQLAYERSVLLLPFRIDAAIGISNAVMSDVLKSVSADRYIQIGNPADFLENASCEELSTPIRSVICVARLAAVKNHEYLLDAWAHVIRVIPDVKLILIGEGELKSFLQIRVEKMALHNSVVFAGYIADWHKVAKVCAFAVLPSLVEGHPVAVMENAALRLPTLVTNVDGSRDTVPPGVILPNRVELGDSLGFAKVIIEWLNNPNAVVFDGNKFWEYHKSRNSSDAIFKKYLESCWSGPDIKVV